MHRCLGIVLIILIVLEVNIAIVENDGDSVLVSQDLEVRAQENELLDKYNEAKKLIGEDVQRHDRLVERIHDELLKLYETTKGARGTLSEDSLILLGDLARKVQPVDVRASTSNVTSQQELINKATTFYEEAYKLHHSVEGYFKLAQCSQAMGNMEGSIGNETGKDHLLQQASSMYLVAASQGHEDAMKEFSTMCEKNLGFGPDGCPEEIRARAYRFYEKIVELHPSPASLGKLSLLLASGFGQDTPDLPSACSWAARANALNEELLEQFKTEAGKKLQATELEAAGYNLDNFILHGNCQYFHNFQHPGNALDRKRGREAINLGLELMSAAHGDYDEKFKENLMGMIGPKREPTYSGVIEWAEEIPGLGTSWYAYLWVLEGRGFFWTPQVRLGDTILSVTQKSDTLVDFKSESPDFTLEAETFAIEVAGVSPAYMSGKAKHIIDGETVLGNFTFAVVPEGPKDEL